MTRTILAAALTALCLGMSPGNAMAGIYGFPLEELDPDVASNNLSIDFEKATGGGGSLSIVGFATQVASPELPSSTQTIYRGTGAGVTDPGVNVPLGFMGNTSGIPIPSFVSGLFRLTGTLDGSGNFTGNVVVEGSLSAADPKVELLNVTLTAIETAMVGDGKLEFLGTLASAHSSMPLFGMVGGQMGVKFNAPDTISTGGFSFSDSFTYTMMNTASADLGRPVPEPASMAIFASTLVVGCCGLRRQRRKSPAVA